MSSSPRHPVTLEVRRCRPDCTECGVESEWVQFDWWRLPIPEHLRDARFPLHQTEAPPPPAHGEEDGGGDDGGCRWVAVSRVHAPPPPLGEAAAVAVPEQDTVAVEAESAPPHEPSSHDAGAVDVVASITSRFSQTTDRASRVCDLLGIPYGRLLAHSILGHVGDEVTVCHPPAAPTGALVWWARDEHAAVFPIDVTEWQVFPGIAIAMLPWVHAHGQRARARATLAAMSGALDEAAACMPEGVYLDLCSHVKRVHEATTAVAALP